MYNFDEVKSRRGTNSVMWDCIEEKCGRSADEVLPAWVADMDFPTDPKIVEKLTERIATGYLGYAGDHTKYKKAYISWVERRHNLKLEVEDISLIPGVKVGINCTLEALGERGDGVIIQPPVYDPFGKIGKTREMNVVENPLDYIDGDYVMDYEGLEKLARESNNKFLIICNPHNPVGRVWSREELEKVGDICLRNSITIISDEMYSDLTVKNYTPMASISEDVAKITIALSSPSKTFNIMAFNIANLISLDREKASKITEKVLATGHGHLNLGGIYGGEIAYNTKGIWVDEAMSYIKENHTYLSKELKENFAEIKVSRCEGGFLAWIDLRSLGYSKEELEERLLDKGKILLGQGYVYGKQGEGFIRVNLGGTRKKVEEITKRIIEALS